jgi:hypothetical protein
MDQWTTSSYSGGRNPDCVECRNDHDRVLIRDTRHRDLGQVDVPVGEWRALLAAVRAGEL